MDTLLLSIDSAAPSQEALARAAKLIQQGKVVAFPTETVYGLGADATNKQAVDAIYLAKDRPRDNPPIVHIADLSGLPSLTPLRSVILDRLAESFWPGPLTVVVPATEVISESIGCGLSTVAIRMPAHPVALRLIALAGVPIAAPSANLSGRPSPTSAQHVLEDLKGRIPMVLDGGPCRVGIESTVVDLCGGAPTVLRPGIITSGDLEQLLGVPVLLSTDAQRQAQSPGTRYRHYAPHTPVALLGLDLLGAEFVSAVSHFERAARRSLRVGYIGVEPDLGELARRAHVKLDPQDRHGLARGLFEAFRQLDASDLEFIVVRALARQGVGVSLMDRLCRAATVQLNTRSEVEEFLQQFFGQPAAAQMVPVKSASARQHSESPKCAPQ